MRVTKEHKLEIESRNKDIFEMYENGVSVDDISKKYNLSYSRINSIISNLNNNRIRRNRVDYNIYEFYDTSLLSDEEKEILQRKNQGETFAKIAKSKECSLNVVRTKALTAIEKMQRKELTANAYSKKYYYTHLEKERLRSRRKNLGLNKIKLKDASKKQQEIYNLHKQNVSVAEISKEMKCSKQYIYMILKSIIDN